MYIHIYKEIVVLLVHLPCNLPITLVAILPHHYIHVYSVPLHFTFTFHSTFMLSGDSQVISVHEGLLSAKAFLP